MLVSSYHLTYMPKKILVLVTHSLGELDVIFPIFCRISSKQKIEVELVFTVSEVFNKFKNNNFYQFFVKEYGIKSSYCRIYKYKSFSKGSILKKILTSTKNLIIFSHNIKIFSLTKKAFLADVFMHEHTNQLSSNWFLYLWKFLSNKRIFVYSHGHSPHFVKAGTVAKYAHSSTILSFDRRSKMYWDQLGYKRQFVIGYPKFYAEWVQLMKNYSEEIGIEREFAIIYSRPVHEYYMDKDKYIKLLLSSCACVRSKFNNILIIIKPHPRESEEFIKKTLVSNNIENFEISYETSLSYSKFCVLSISFWTSAILDSLSGGIPTLEYYIEAEKFRESERLGSEFKKLGFVSVEDENDLCYYVNNIDRLVCNNETVANQFAKNANTSFL